MNSMVRIVAAALMIFSTSAIMNAAQRHWVGNGAGQGKDWDRAANWSATQGGAGGAGVPTAADDVYIDGGGGLLTINIAAVCLSFNQSQSGHTTNFLGSGSMTIGAGGFHLSAGTFNISNNNNISVAGDWIVTGGTFSSGTSTLTFNGTTPQTFVSGASLYNQVINNSAGLILGSDLTVSNTLTLTSGPIVTGSYSVIVPPSGSIVQGSGYISGNLSKYVATGATTVTFELGSGGSASTVTVGFGSVGTTGYLTASSTSGDHPNIGSSAINPNYSVNRYWTLANNGVVFDTYGVTFQYGAGDIDPLADPLTFQVGRYASSAWSAPTVGTRTATSTQVTGLTGFGDFAIGHAAVYDTITAVASPGGTIAPSGDVAVMRGSNQSFTITPDAGHHIDSVVVDGGKTDSTTGYTFMHVTANHSISAYFTVDTMTITATASAGGSISPSGTVPVPYGGDRSFTVTPDAGYHIDSVVVDGANQGAAGSYDFTNVTTDHAIDAYFSVNVYTITAAAPAGGAISPSGAVPVNHGTDRSFTVTPDAGYHIDSVVVDGANQGAVGSYDFTNVTADHAIDAYFSIDMYAITASAGTGGSIDPSGAVPVAHGSDQSFTITPDVGYFIADVHVDTVSVGAVGSYTFTNVTADHSIEAFFDPYTFTLSAFAGPNGSISPAGDSVVNYGESVSYAISPSTGYYISDVFVDSVSVGPVDAYTFSGVTEDHSIQAFFAIQQFTVTATAGPNGTVAPAGASTVDYGGSIGYTITPNTGYYIADVHVDSASVGAVASYTFNNVTADHTIEAWFSITAYTITATSSSGGAIAPSGPVGVNHGENRSFTMTPDPGHHLDSVVVDGTNLGAVASYEFTNVTASHTIAAYFSVNMYTITASAGTGGGIAPSGEVAVAHGSDVTFTVTPNTGYFIADVHVDTVSVGAAASYTFTNVTSDHVIEAFFAVQTFTVTAVAGPNGSVSPSGATVVNYGDSLHIAVTPAGGYFVTDVHVDSVSVGPVTGYTFSNITSDHLLEAFFGTNAPPSGPTLVSPVDGDTITTDQLGSVVFAWNPSTDPDAGDTLVYEVHITGPGVDYTAGGLTDTTADLDLSAVLAAGSAYRWTVTVSDGMATVASADTFTIRVDLATDVADDADLLPKVYALRQNYPNPFNPVTAIPFDLPERSTVTLRVFNVLGVQVMEIFSDESIGAGSYRNSVDFSGLSSGAYFYRLSARGESGTVFEKVMKMVVLK